MLSCALQLSWDVTVDTGFVRDKPPVLSARIKEVNEAKWSGMRWSEVQYREGGEQVFVGKVYRVVSDEKWRTGVKAWVN